ncbi:NlpC/P60 family protein [Nonomuraea sp. NPDC048916]|uniref:bifunctional WXG100 family type VII secretion target/C40 family peptidase n=1 Tax=Nonomuraea sp. NPDC048916 TaxID=3154232 RepID=UPI0033D4D9B4
MSDIWDTYLAPIRRIIDDLTADQGEIAKISKRWRTLATDVTAHTGALKRAVNTVDDAWNGGAAENFTTYMAKYPQYGTQLSNALTSSADKIDAAGNALESARRDVQTIYDEKRTWLDEQRKKSDTSIPMSLIRSQVQDALGRAAGPKQRAIDAVDAATTEIDKHAGDVKFFTAIPAPGDQDFYPKNNPQLHWIVDPKFKERGTTQLAGDNGNGAQNGGGGGSGSRTYRPEEIQVPANAKDLAKNPEAQKILDYALAQLGDPYVWGAEGPNSFDCSGLTLRAYEAAGIDLPRVAQDQWLHGPRIPDGDVQAGDLIFFDNDGDGTADHVGIVLDPEKQTMIHAPNSTTVVKISDYGNYGSPRLGFTRPGNS